jgi:spermidine synthase
MRRSIERQGDQCALGAGAALTIAGSSAVIGQIVLMRELISLYNGSELSLGILLATWLFWSAAGSLLCGSLPLREGRVRGRVGALACLLGVSLPATVWALRASKSLLQTVPGELVGPVATLLASLVCLSVFCMTAGALFVAAARMINDSDARRAAGAAYLLEAAGSAVGGVVASLLLLRFLSPMQIATLVLVLNLWLASILLLRIRIVVASAVAVLPALLLVVGVAPRVEWQTRTREWSGFRLLGSTDSIYGNLTVIESGGVRSLYENGLILANAPDESAAEESVHYALLEHPSPRRILLIGGGANGAVAEALKHPTVERVDLVELDPALLGMVRDDLPANAAPRDARVVPHTADGRAFLHASRASYDEIIVGIPDPQSAQLNRYYTVEFFRSARAHLAPGGLLALQLRSSEEAMSPDQAEFLRSIKRSLQEVFPAVVAIPGDTIHFFAATRQGLLTEDAPTLVERLMERHLQTRYVREYFIPFRMTADRMEQARADLEPQAATRINRDFAPIAYYYNTILWSAQFRPAYAEWLRRAGSTRFASILGGVLIAAVLLALAAGGKQRPRTTALCSTAATGFTLMALEMILLLGFQSIYGFLYSQLALLIALFMAGIAVGGWLGLQLTGSPRRAVAITQLLLMLSAPLLMLALSLLAMPRGSAVNWLAAEIVFPALAALGGMLGGCQFTQAAQLFLAGDRGAGWLGWLYSVDLLGGSAGALVLSGFLIPVFGFWPTAWLTAAVSLAPVLMAARLCIPRRVGSY